MSEKLSLREKMFGTRDMASCLEVGRVLQSYLDGHVDELTARRVARHLERCRMCGLDEQTYRAIKRSLAGRGARAVDPDAVARLRAFGAELAAGHGDESPSAGSS